MRNLACSLLAMVAACGGDDGGNARVDAASEQDSGPHDAPGDLTPVTIRIIENGVGVEGVRVHFQNPDSSLITSASTNASGEASSPMPNGGFVSAIDPFNQAGQPVTYVTSYAAVEPGDVLELRSTDFVSGPFLTISLAEDTSPGVAQYLYSTTCRSTFNPANSLNIDLNNGCLPSTDLLGASVDANNEVVHWAYFSNINPNAGTVDFSSVELVGSPASKMYTFENLPQDLVEFTVGLRSSKGIVVRFQGDGTTSTVSETLKLTPFSNATEVIDTTAVASNSDHYFLDWAPFSTTAYTMDVPTRMIRDATSGADFDAANKRAFWTEAATGESPDFARAEIQAYRTGASSMYIHWDIIGPYSSGGQFSLPTLPVEGSVDYNIAAGDTTDTTVTLGKVPGGYGAVREIFYGISGTEVLAIGSVSGTAAFQKIFDGGQQMLLAPMARLLRPFVPRPDSMLDGLKHRRAR